VSVPILEGLTETLQPDDVGVGAGVGKQRLSVTAHKQGQMVLDGTTYMGVFEMEELALEVDSFPVDETADHLDGVSQSAFAAFRRLEGDAHCGILLWGMPGSQTQFEASSRQVIQSYRLPRELDRISHVGV
jgi:hypothetical protein